MKSHHFSSHDQQWVSDSTNPLHCRNLNLMMCWHSMTNRQWVTQPYFCAQKFDQSHLISWPPESGLHWFISLPGSLIGYVWWLLSHDQQYVSDKAALFICQAVSSIMSHPMTNSEWVTLWYLFARHLINPVSSHDQQDVSETALFKSHLIPWPTASEWHYLLFARQSH